MAVCQLGQHEGGATLALKLKRCAARPRLQALPQTLRRAMSTVSCSARPRSVAAKEGSPDAVRPAAFPAWIMVSWQLHHQACAARLASNPTVVPALSPPLCLLTGRQPPGSKLK